MACWIYRDPGAYGLVTVAHSGASCGVGGDINVFTVAPSLKYAGKPETFDLKFTSAFLILSAVMMSTSPSSFAQGPTSAKDTTKANRIWKLVNGTYLPAQSPILKRISETLAAHGMDSAVKVAMGQASSTFVTGAVRTFATPMAGREANFSEPSGDFVLSLMAGALKDKTFKDMLTGEKSYVYMNERLSPTEQIDKELSKIFSDAQFSKKSTPANSAGNSPAPLFSEIAQNQIVDPAFRLGVITTEQYGKSAFEGGTNRRAVKKLIEDFTCRSLESRMRFDLDDHWVSKDVTKAPGGDVKIYSQRCVGCHAGMDATRSAFSGYDFVNAAGRLTWSPTPQAKLNLVVNFEEAPAVTGFAWEDVGWLGLETLKVGQVYTGPRPLVEAVVASNVFSRCMAQRAHRTLCPDVKLDPKTILSVSEKSRKVDTIKEYFANAAAQSCISAKDKILGVSTRWELLAQLELSTAMPLAVKLEPHLVKGLPRTSSVTEITQKFIRSWAQIAHNACADWAEFEDEKKISKGNQSFLSLIQNSWGRGPDPEEAASFVGLRTVDACTRVLINPLVYLKLNPSVD